VPTPSDLSRRRSLLTAALAIAPLDTRGKPPSPETLLIRTWLDTWRGLGDVVVGMQRQGYRLHLTNIDATTWLASFSGAPLLASDGFGAASTPWRAVQLAAWEALRER
jgi:hypothetical protein